MKARQKVHKRSQARTSRLSHQLLGELWAGLRERLKEGEVMVDNHHFSSALASEYGRLTGDEPSDDLRGQFHRMVDEINRKHPETYLAEGVRNGVRKAFEQGISKLKWDASKIQAMGTSSMRRFTRQEEIVELLEDFHLQPDQLDLLECVTSILREMAPESDGAWPDLAVNRTQPAAGAADGRMSLADLLKAAETITPGISADLAVGAAPNIAPPVAAAPAKSAHQTTEADLQAAVAMGEIDQAELRKRSGQQDRIRQDLTRREGKRVEENLDAHVESGVLSAREAEQVRALRKIDKQVERGELTERAAERARNRILKGEDREKLERKVKEAVDHAVIYLHVHQAMQRIDPQNDEPLNYLIRNKEAVTADTLAADLVTATLQGLMDDVPLLEGLVDIMERKDQEIRMLSVRMPPYNAIAGRGLEKIGNMLIDEDFIGELRANDEEAMSAQLNSSDKMQRVKPAAAMRCFISLIDHLTKRTPFRKQIRLCKINLTLERFFRDSPNIKEARHQAEHFLERRLRRLFPEMSPEESREIKQRGAQMIDSIEEQTLTERQEAVGAKKKTKEAAQSNKSTAGPADDMELTDEERQKGVQIGRVESRIGGSMRRIPLKIMPDEEDPSAFVVVQRDPETGELVPQMRRGQKRMVEKGRDGMWRPVK